MFSRLSQAFKSVIQTLKKELRSIFTQPKIDQATINDLYRMLLSADVGVQTTNHLIKNVETLYKNGTIKTGADLAESIQKELTKFVSIPCPNLDEQKVLLLVGINGSGKTTLAAKLTNYFQQHNKSVLLVAGDTFRAAATNQLANWASKLNASILIGKPEQDPSSVIFDGCKEFLAQQHNVMIIDTAGRLQTKENLMKELEKIKRTIHKALPNHEICTILTIDALLGQNSLQQAHIFHQSTQLTGIALTKMDSSGKGGIAFAISHELKVPVMLVSLGEHVNALEKFNAQAYVEAILAKDDHE